jgi:large subunit ribosomal protein L17
VTSLLRHERIETTEAKGKEIRAISDKMISLGLDGNLAARRAVNSYLQDPKVAARLFSEVAPLFKADKPTGGYTRLIKTRVRYGDGAPMVIVELTKRTASAPAPEAKKADETEKDKAKETPVEAVEKEKAKKKPVKKAVSTGKAKKEGGKDKVVEKEKAKKKPAKKAPSD